MLVWIIRQCADTKDLIQPGCFAISIRQTKQMPFHQNADVVGEVGIYICTEPIVAGFADAIDGQPAADRVGEDMLNAEVPFTLAKDAQHMTRPAFIA
jgi:hypothetical protein